MAVPVQFTSIRWFRDWYVSTRSLKVLSQMVPANHEIGLFVGSYVSNRWGRRMCVFTMSLWGLVAAAIIVTAKDRDHLLAGRVLNCA